jgi:uncharacterized delta-60 repeat protein
MRRTTTAIVVFLVSLACMTGVAAAFIFGELDNSFGNGGIATIVPSGSTLAGVNAIAAQPDGKLIVAGIGDGTNPMWVQRLLPSGALDTTFGAGGTFVFSDLNHPQPNAIALQPDGKILIAGSAHTGSDIQLLVRLNSNGTLDTASDVTPGDSFGIGGIGYIAATAATGDSDLADVQPLSNGDILAAGTYKDSGDEKPLLHRYDSSGALDTTFGANATTAFGAFKTDFGDPVRVRILLDPNGHYVVALGASSQNFTAIKLNTDGTIVNGYGASGFANLGSAVGFSDAVIDSTGRITFAGATYTANPTNTLTLGRVDAFGQPDSGFGTAGLAVFNATPNDRSTAMGVRQLSDGRYLALVLSFTTSSTRPYVGTAVFTASGQPETSYGNGGATTYPALGANLSGTYPIALELLPGDRALLVGSGSTAPAVQAGFVAKLRGVNDPDPIVPTSTVSSPKKSKTAAKKLTKFAGTAAPAGKIAKVEIAVQKVDSKLLKKKRRCLWLSSNKAKFKKIKAVQKKCATPRWLTANGTTAWTYKLKRKLPKGSYRLSVRSTATDGNVQAVPTLKKFKIT